MNYSALIENRKSQREFTDKQVPMYTIASIRNYFDQFAQRLVPDIRVKLQIFAEDSKEALEGAAGYNNFLIGAPHYLVLLSEKHPQAYLNGGYIMEDLILKLTDMDLGSCWITFTDSDAVKQALDIRSDLDVVAIAAFGYSVKTTKRLRLNIKSMSNVDISAKRDYFEPKKRIREIAFNQTWGNSTDLEEVIGFYDDMLWEALRAVTFAPSYLNRQSYGFLLDVGKVWLVEAPDKYNNAIDGDLSLGAALLHFSVVAQQWAGKLYWNFDADNQPVLPEGYRMVAWSNV